MIWLFSKNFWNVFGQRLLETLFRPTHFRYNFGFGRRDVKDVCKYWKDSETAKALNQIIREENIAQDTDYLTLKRLMRWLLNTYPPKKYYSYDNGERWNKPLETLMSFEEKRASVKRSYPTDCDDYAILIYNMARLAGVSADNLRLCFMKTEKEWHLNVMFIDEYNVPYAIEGTYYPEKAYKNFGKIPYFHNTTTRRGKKIHYYEGVRWMWNEDQVWVNTGKLNKV